MKRPSNATRCNEAVVACTATTGADHPSSWLREELQNSDNRHLSFSVLDADVPEISVELKSNIRRNVAWVHERLGRMGVTGSSCRLPAKRPSTHCGTGAGRTSTLSDRQERETSEALTYRDTFFISWENGCEVISYQTILGCPVPLLPVILKS